MPPVGMPLLYPGGCFDLPALPEALEALRMLLDRLNGVFNTGGLLCELRRPAEHAHGTPMVAYPLNA